MENIHWGIIGCGDVTEVKSGPAFNKVPGSFLLAVMRRDAGKAADYAKRHHVPKWYNDASKLINDPEVNAIYIATPPSSHEAYAIAAIEAGKPVYIEKPMSTDQQGAQRITAFARQKKIKVSIAHYRRAQPQFIKIKQLLKEKIIGETLFVKLEYFKQAPSVDELSTLKLSWRVDPAISGGGLFHDLAPHQLDLIYYFFGKAKMAKGISLNQQKKYKADDIVAGEILFTSGILFSGLWSFNAPADAERDVCEIVGTRGKISFSIFDKRDVSVTVDGNTRVLTFEALAHAQQPMIEKVSQYFLDKGSNPCSSEDGVAVMKMIDAFVR